MALGMAIAHSSKNLNLRNRNVDILNEELAECHGGNLWYSLCLFSNRRGRLRRWSFLRCLVALIVLNCAFWLPLCSFFLFNCPSSGLGSDHHG